MIKIKVVIFDLGNVVVKFDHHIATKRLSDMSGVSESDIYDHIFTSGLERLLDCGKIDPQEFFRRLKDKLGIRLKWEEFRPVWADIFQTNSEMEELLRALKGKFRLCLLSNTNEVHFSFVKDRFPIVDIFDEHFLSYSLHTCKPEKKIYRAVLDRCNVRPQDCVYIDDIPEYVDAAVKLGFCGIRYTDTEDLKRRLAQIRVTC